MPRPRRANMAFIKENFGSIWPAHLSAFTRLLTQLRAHFDGDLDLLLIMATIGERTLPERWRADIMTDAKLTLPGEGLERQFPINVQSVAEYSGIPRETVRRKVAILQDKGLVLRRRDGRLSVSPTAAAMLAEATGDTLEYLQVVCAAFEDAAERKLPG